MPGRDEARRRGWNSARAAPRGMAQKPRARAGSRAAQGRLASRRRGRDQQNEKGTVMLITFKCRATPDVMMMENLAQYLVGIVGKNLGQRGVITHDELGNAITKLEAAIVTDKQERAEHDGHFHEGEEGHEPHEIPIGLAQRAYPFLDMLRTAQKENADIVWGI
jgi:Domain of unknown function (DUF1840)